MNGLRAIVSMAILTFVTQLIQRVDEDGDITSEEYLDMWNRTPVSNVAPSEALSMVMAVLAGYGILSLDDGGLSKGPLFAEAKAFHDEAEKELKGGGGFTGDPVEDIPEAPDDIDFDKVFGDRL